LYLEKEIPLSTCEFEKLSLRVVDKDGEVLSTVCSKEVQPKVFDSYFIPHKISQNKQEDYTAEGYFKMAENLSREWMFHIPQIRKLLGESLRIDPMFSRAHTELGIIELKGGNFEKSIDHFNKSLSRIYDDGRTLYYKGLALWLSGDIGEAIYQLRQSSRFGYEYQERVVEAQIAINSNNLNLADKHLRKAIKFSKVMCLPFILRAIVLKKLGNLDEAQLMMTEGKKASPHSPISDCAYYILTSQDQTIKEQIQQKYEDAPEELLEVAALFYSSGLIVEAVEVLGLINANNDIINFYRMHMKCDINLGRSDTGSKNDFAWRLDELIMLKKELKNSPYNAELYYHLGNFYYGRGFEDDGINNWEKAYGLGFKNKVLLYQLFRAYSRRGNDEVKGKYINEAYALYKDDVYIYDSYIDFIQEKEGINAATDLLEKDMDQVVKYFARSHMLLRNYLLLKDYDKFEALALRVNTAGVWKWNESYAFFWYLMKMAKGYKKMIDTKYEEALKEFENALEVPKNLSSDYIFEYVERVRRLFYIGLCHYKTGDRVSAIKFWEEALTYDQQSTIEIIYDFNIMKARYFQAFCLRGLNRFNEADVYIHGIKKFAQNAKLQDDAKLIMLKLGYLGEEQDINKFDKYDTELGITSFDTTDTSAER
jgi:tetratricopeptide (TPR) repeat protein